MAGVIVEPGRAPNESSRRAKAADRVRRRLSTLMNAALVRSLVRRGSFDSLGDRFAHGAAWSLLSSVASRGFTLIAGFVLAHLLGRSGFGEFSTVQSTVGTVLVLAGLGLGMTATKYVAELRHVDPGRASRMAAFCGTMGLLVGVAFGSCLVAFAHPIAARLLGADRLATPIRVSAILILFGTLVNMQNGALTGLEAFDSIARISLVTGPVGLILVTIGTVNAGVTGAIFCLGVTQALNWTLNRRALALRLNTEAMPVFIWPTRREWSALYHYSAPTLASSLLIAVTNWAAIALLVNTRNGYSQMGIFGAANQWLIALLVLPTIIGQVVFPHATRILKTDQQAAFKMLRGSTILAATISLPIVLLGSLASPWIMRAYGAGFNGTWITLIVVLCTAGVMAVQTPAIHVISASGRMWLLLATYLLWSSIFIGGAALGSSHGANGLAAARLIAYVIHSFSIVVLARYVLRNPNGAAATSPTEQEQPE